MNKATNKIVNPLATIPEYQIGEIFFSIDPTLETSGQNAIRLGPARTLDRTTYWILYNKLRATNLIVEDDLESPYFTIKAIDGYDYLKNVPDGVVVDIQEQNIPIPAIGNQSASHTHSLKKENCATVADNANMGSYSFYDVYTDGQSDAKGVLEGSNLSGDGDQSAAGDGGNSWKRNVNLNMVDSYAHKVAGTSEIQSASHNHSIAPDANLGYTTSPILQPKSLAVYMYIRADV